jgi:phosphonate transport system substrate-binding protein
VRAQLRILWKSPGYTPHAFSAHPRVPAPVVEKLQQALRELVNHPEGLDVLKNVNFGAIEPAVDNDWEDIRKLNIDAIKSVN